MTPLASLFRVKSPSLRNTRPLTDNAAQPAEPDWSESGWSFHDSSNELLQGVEVIEHPAPPNMAQLLQLFTARRAVVQ